MPRQYKNCSKPAEDIRNTKHQAKRPTSAENLLPNTEPSAKQKRNNTELAIITAIETSRNKNQKTKGVWSIRERKLKSIGINFSCIPTPEKVKIQEKNQRGFELKRD